MIVDQKTLRDAGTFAVLVVGGASIVLLVVLKLTGHIQ